MRIIILAIMLSVFAAEKELLSEKFQTIKMTVDRHGWTPGSFVVTADGKATETVEKVQQEEQNLSTFSR